MKKTVFSICMLLLSGAASANVTASMNSCTSAFAVAFADDDDNPDGKEIKMTAAEEYALKEQECHGMKEIISLLTFLSDDSNNCLSDCDNDSENCKSFVHNNSFLIMAQNKRCCLPKSGNVKNNHYFFLLFQYYFLVHIQNLNHLL